MFRPLTALVVPAFILSVSGTVSAAVLNVKFTSQALGLGSSEINEGTTVESNIAGKLITSSVTGFGSTLFVQRSGLAGSGTISDPLLLKVTCRTRLDTVTGLPGSGGSEGNNNNVSSFDTTVTSASHDYQAGVLYVSRNGTTSVGKDEGLGVRAFATNSSGLRTFSSGKAKITGSIEMSGGTGPSAFDPSPTDEPLDEEITVEYSPTSQMVGDSIAVSLSKFQTGDRIELTINLVGGSILHFASLSDSSSALDSLGNNVQKLSFSKLSGLSSTAVVSSFTIRAIGDGSGSDGSSNTTTGNEGVLLSGLSGTLVPGPGAASLLAVAGLMAARRRR